MPELDALNMENISELPDGYRMTELGPLPAEWRVARLEEITANCFCGVWGDDPEELKEGEERVLAKVIRVSDINSDSRIAYYEVPARAVRTKQLQKYQLKRGDIVVVKSSGSKSRIISGRSAIFEPPNNGETFIPSNFTLALRINSEVSDAYFVWYYLLTRQSKEWVDHIVEGSTYPNLKKTEYMMMPIPLPPLPEQRAIAHVLRTVQKAKEATERVTAALRELKKSLMRHLFTYGLVPLDAADRVELKETEIGPIPAHWRVAKMGETVRLTKGRKPANLLKSPIKDGLPYLTAEYFRSNIPEQFVPRDILNTVEICEADDVVLIWDGSKAGQVFTGLKGVLASTMVKLEPATDDLARSFLYFFLLTQFETLNSQTTGSTIPHVNKNVFFNLPIPLPPLPEQREIARILQAVDEKIRAEEKRKEALEALFKALLHYLMTAKIRLPKEFVTQFEGVNSSG